MSRIGGGPDRPKRDISPEIRRRGARRVDGGGKARDWEMAGNGRPSGTGRGRREQSQRGAATKAADSSRLRTHADAAGAKRASGPRGYNVRRTILVGLHGFTQGRPNFYFSLSLRALELNLNIPYY